MLSEPSRAHDALKVNAYGEHVWRRRRRGIRASLSGVDGVERVLLSDACVREDEVELVAVGSEGLVEGSGKGGGGVYVALNERCALERGRGRLPSLRIEVEDCDVPAAFSSEVGGEGKAYAGR